MTAGWPGNNLGKATINPGALGGAPALLGFYPLLFRVDGMRCTRAVGRAGKLAWGMKGMVVDAVGWTG